MNLKVVKKRGKINARFVVAVLCSRLDAKPGNYITKRERALILLLLANANSAQKLGLLVALHSAGLIMHETRKS